ncbi:MAG TPA: LysM domain-containing protein [Candidatus Paceibacterota bacterium]|nr:LysM domain-containing protein [Candidatus Paceibacterota bacterium]
MAVFLALGGLLLGFAKISIVPHSPAGTVQEQRVSSGPSIIPQAEGAEVDSAALTPQSAPFLATVSAGAEGVGAVEDANVLYDDGALKASGQIQKTTSFAPSVSASKIPASSIVYQVKATDTLKSISAAFGIPMNTIVQFNPSVNFSSLAAGTSIVIPGQSDIAFPSGKS